MEGQYYPVEIIDYDDQYKDDIKRLTLEWLEKGFLIEPEDIKFMDNPTEYVIENGGFIFLAKHHNEIVGTISLCKVNANTFEIAKLAVTEKHKGLKIGRQLLQTAIDKCNSLGAEKVILYTTKKLEVAYNLYVKFGFAEVDDVHKKYLEADSTMELDLTK